MNKDLQIPNLGSSSAVEVVEILVKVGDRISIDTPLCVVESEKSSFDITSLYSGTIRSLSLSLGQKIQSGQSFGVVEIEAALTGGTAAPAQHLVTSPQQNAHQDSAQKEPLHSPRLDGPSVSAPAPSVLSAPIGAKKDSSLSVLYASPLVRKLARSQGVTLSDIAGTGPMGRITLEDLQTRSSSGSSAYSLPSIDSLPDRALWGNLTSQPLSKVQKVAAQRFQRSWTNIPHVTHFDVAIVDDLEAFRVQTNAEHKSDPSYTKLTLLSFIFKALAAALREDPVLNSSLSSCGQKLILKDSIHIGCAVETPQGLLVPVLRDVDTLSIMDIKNTLATMATKARSGQLLPQDYQGQTFTVSSLGSHGGRFFTPIIQWPDVAILGVCKTYTEPCIRDGSLVSKLVLPLSLSYDHRVIDGGRAARFTNTLISYLEDFKRITL